MNKCKELRLEHGLTIKELAKVSGISQGVLSNFERTNRITPQRAKKLADYYKVSVKELLGGEILNQHRLERSERNKVTGEILRSLREQKGLTQIELAEKLGKTHPSIARWERGVNTPSMKTLELMAEFFDVEIRYLRGYKGDDRILSDNEIAVDKDIFEKYKKAYETINNLKELTK